MLYRVCLPDLRGKQSKPKKSALNQFGFGNITFRIGRLKAWISRIKSWICWITAWIWSIAAWNYLIIRGDFEIPHSRMTKACWWNVGNLFVICMWQVTKSHLYHLLGVSDYYVMYRQSTKSILWNFCKGHQLNWVTDPLRWLCELLWKVCV